MTQDPQPPYPEQPPAWGTWEQPTAQQPVVPPAPGVPAVPAYPTQPAAPGYHPVAPAVPAYYGYGPVAPQAAPASGMYVAAAAINWVVFGLIVLGTCGIGIIAAAWFVPMTIFIHKGARDRSKHTALGVCTLLFCNIISGILMLVEDSNR